MQNISEVEVRGIRVLTTKQIAEAYKVETKQIKQNFSNNKMRYIEGKHYIALEKQELREFKNRVENFDLVEKRANTLYLWTEKGALLHAKSLNTDKAWEVYDYLVDHYFRTQEKKQEPPKSKAPVITVVDVPDNPQILEGIQKIQDDLTAMNVLLRDCKKYLDEKTYKDRVETICGVLHILVGDVSRFRDLRPKMVEKYY